MKRKVGLVAAVAALGVGIYFGSRLWAQQQPAAAQPPAQTRVAVVNIIQVIKKFHKFTTFNAEMGRLAKPFEDKDKEYRKAVQQCQDAIKDPKTAPAERDKAEQTMKAYQRGIEDNAQEAKKVLAKKNDEQMVQLYREVEDAVTRYATSNGFHIVLAHDEKVPATEAIQPANIQRKLQGTAGTGGTFLMYAAPGLDITQGVTTALNSGAQAPAPAPGGAAPQGGQR
ncbi:MAG: OmpH family outer membrane protein [Gemmataceae bacterium]|nr:OmpH family outer membrane protein [Gemmataceae bacterium]